MLYRQLNSEGELSIQALFHKSRLLHCLEDFKQKD